MFCHVTRACAGVVFSSVEVVKNLINTTSAAQGLKVVASICDKIYLTARKVATDLKQTMTILFDDFLGKWNYRAIPQNP
jgi:Rhodopirellula transposase DDE domain